MKQPVVEERRRHRRHEAAHEDGRRKPPGSQKKRGKCQRDTSGATIMVATSGEYPDPCSPARAKPCQPGFSPSGPSVGLTRRIANTMRKVVKEANVSDGTPAPVATFEPHDGQVDRERHS